MDDSPTLHESSFAFVNLHCYRVYKDHNFRHPLHRLSHSIPKQARYVSVPVRPSMAIFKVILANLTVRSTGKRFVLIIAR